MSVDYPGVPPFTGNVPSWIQRAYTVIDNLLLGKTNNVTTLTLTANAASTTLTDPRISFQSVITLVATTANAAAELGNGTIYQLTAGRVNGSRVFTHNNNAQVDRTFDVTIVG